jgi:hypothetical protein
MWKIFKYAGYFGLLACVGILLGCWIHGIRTNQPTIMSGVAFVRELPHGEFVVGYIETAVFTYQEKKSLESFKEQNKTIQIDPEVLKRHEEMFKGSQRKN